jgi:two-component system sensor histidine kinase QseC
MSAHPPSLRRQLALALAGCLSFLCLCANLTYYHYIRDLSIEEFDEALQKDLEAVVAMTSIHDGGHRIELQIHNHEHPEYQEHDEAKYYHISHGDGRCHLRSPSLNETSLPKLSEGHGHTVVEDLILPDGRRGRVISTHNHLDESGGDASHKIHFALAVSRESLDRILELQRWCALAVGALLIAASIGIALVLTQRSFKKVDAFSEHLQSIDFDTLGNRLPAEGLPVELAPLATRFNEALERLDRGAQREIRFNANVAHELRTPVAELRAIAEVGLQEAEAGELDQPSAYFQDAADLARRMGQLVDTLSSLNRSGLGRQHLQLETVDLADLIQRTWRNHALQAKQRGLTTSFEGPDSCIMETDPALMAALLSNLMNNAASHTPEGGEIHIALQASPCTLSISNTNHHLREEDLPHLIEPFWQKDASRSDSSHFGIGLALVDAYTRLLRIHYALQLPEARVFRITLTFPTSEEA